jgi:hypothetical protein
LGQFFGSRRDQIPRDTVLYQVRYVTHRASQDRDAQGLGFHYDDPIWLLPRRDYAQGRSFEEPEQSRVVNRTEKGDASFEPFSIRQPLECTLLGTVTCDQ